MDGNDLNFLFAVWMVGGVQTIFDSLKDFIGQPAGMQAFWLPIEMDPSDWITLVPPISFYGLWRNSMATWLRSKMLAWQKGKPDAVYFLEHSIIPPHWSFMGRTPYVLAMDHTPLFCAKHKLWYAVPEFDPTSSISRLKQKYVAQLYRGAFHLLPFSTGVRDSLIEDYGIPEERMTVLPPGINLKLWQSPDRTPRADPSQPLNVLHVGWDFKRKGADLLVTLAREEAFRHVEFHFVTAGLPGPLPDNVAIHTGIEPNSPELIELYSHADIFVLPTRADVFSMASLEAMAMSLPVITTRVGGIGDIILEGETGYCVAPDDLDALRDRLQRLVADRSLRLRMGERGRRRVEEKFNLERHTEMLLECMKQAALSRR